MHPIEVVLIKILGGAYSQMLYKIEQRYTSRTINNASEMYYNPFPLA